MKILYVTTIAETMRFFPQHIRLLQAEGHIVELACNMGKPLPDAVQVLGCKAHHVSFSRSPISKGNLIAYGELKKLVATGAYDVVHTHTPNASALVRLVCRNLRKKGLRVIYTAHGFHFYKGAPLKNWLIYYPVEKLCARMTDTLITMNQEDYALAQKKLAAKDVVYVPGVGINTDGFESTPEEVRVQKRAELGIPQDAFVLLSVGELNRNKNHETAIRAVSGLDVYYLIAGRGDLQPHLQAVIDELGCSDRVKLLGYRTDVRELYRAVDLFVFPSFREGLPVSVMEAMASGLPCVASDIRGVRDLVVDGENGLLCNSSDVVAMTKAVSCLAEDVCLREQFAVCAKKRVKAFGHETVGECMMKIYNKREVGWNEPV